MARFLNKLRVEEVNDAGGGRWRLLAPLLYDSDIVPNLIAVPKGYCTDFGSVPRLPFAYAWFGNIARQPAVVHDFAYSTHFVDRATADAILREAMAATGVSWIQRWAWWFGVRLFGWQHW